MEKAKERIKAKTGPFGSLKWYASMQGEDRRACFLGRLVGLYAHGAEMTDGRTLDAFCSRFRNPENRAAFLHTLIKWLDGRPSKNWRRQYASVCVEVPGVNGESLKEEPFDMESFRRSVDWEIARLDARECLVDALNRLWGGAFDNRAFMDLGLPAERYTKYRQMDELVGLDVERCLNEAWNAVVDDPYFCARPDFGGNPEALEAWLAEPGRAACRARFVEAWRREEERLLAMTPAARNREYEEEGV